MSLFQALGSDYVDFLLVAPYNASQGHILARDRDQETFCAGGYAVLVKCILDLYDTFNGPDIGIENIRWTTANPSH